MIKQVKIAYTTVEYYVQQTTTNSINLFHCLGLAWPDWCRGRRNRFKGIRIVGMSRWWWMTHTSNHLHRDVEYRHRDAWYQQTHLIRHQDHFITPRQHQHQSSTIGVDHLIALILSHKFVSLSPPGPSFSLCPSGHLSFSHQFFEQTPGFPIFSRVVSFSRSPNCCSSILSWSWSQTYTFGFDAMASIACFW